MYTLRTIFQTGIERNNFIGKNYELIHKHNQEFDYYFKDLFPNPEQCDIEGVFCLLITDEITIPLYYVHQYYVVNENGGTFTCLTAPNKHPIAD